MTSSTLSKSLNSAGYAYAQIGHKLYGVTGSNAFYIYNLVNNSFDDFTTNGDTFEPNNGMCFAYSKMLDTLFVIGAAQQAAKLNISSLEWISLEQLSYVVN